jgi:hypothetical protein
VSTTPNPNSNSWRIILLRHQAGVNPEVLLGSSGMQRSLPQVVIPRWQRVAESLAAALKNSLGIDVISLVSLRDSSADPNSVQVHYEIMELYAPSAEVPPRWEWIAIDRLVESAFRDLADFQAVEQAVAQSVPHGKGISAAPFASVGWFHNLQQWVQEQVETQGFQLTGAFRQLNASATFSLIRFETNGPAFWFKAVGAPNQHEYPLTMALARSFPRFLPEILATRPQLNGWLAREAEGFLLQELSGLSSWEAAATSLAELQIASLGGSLQFLDPGARDLRSRMLADFVEPFFQSMAELMEHQTTVPPAPLSRDELGRLSSRVQDALAVLQETGIHPTLGHLDINPGNVVCSRTGCVFLDWAEAFVGHPFLTFEYLLEHFRRAFGQNHPQETRFVASYTSPWHAFLTETDIRRALEVAPLVAVFACAVGNDLWSGSRRIEDPRPLGFLRSLTRRMARETQALIERSVSCPS